MQSTEARFKRDSDEFPRLPGKSPGSKARLQLVRPSAVSLPVGPSVAILLCIYHGKHFLEEQLESIAQQTHKNWKLYVSDDGDCEDSRRILEKFSKRFEQGRVSVRKGPQKGFVENFLSLTCDSSISADYFAFSDQDDIWNQDKLENAIQALGDVDQSIPSLYCSRTIVVDKSNNEIGKSPLFTRAPSFSNALVQCIGGANTMTFNRNVRDIAVQVGKNIPAITHDWWMYLLTTGVGGRVIYDSKPSIRYRQHESNRVGCNITLRAKLYRVYLLVKGRFKDYNDRNIKSLGCAYHLLTKENQKIYDEFVDLRKSAFIKRINRFRRLKIYRQTDLGNFGIWLSVLLKKL